MVKKKFKKILFLILLSRHLADIDKDNQLNENEFVLGLFLLEKKILGFKLPQTLPKSLLQIRKPSEINTPPPTYSPSTHGTSSPSQTHPSKMSENSTPKDEPNHLNANIIEPPAPSTPLLSRFDDEVSLKKKKKTAHRKKNPNLSIQHAMEKYGEKEDSGIVITIHQYSESNLEHFQVKSVNEISSNPPSWAKVRWINFEGFNHKILESLARKFHIHELAIQDVEDIPQSEIPF